MSDFFDNYFDLINNKNKIVKHKDLELISKIIEKVNRNGGQVIIVGNGGSAAIASHVAIDFTKAANIPATTFNESSLLTCFANDYGYEHWVEKALEFHARKNDMVILISSSGESRNIINGAKKAKEMKLPLITLSGFSEKNELKEMGDVNLWIDSTQYNIVEIVHQTWILSIVDFLIEKDI